MKILITGVTGYIGKRLLSVLKDSSHEIICVVRDKNRLDLAQDTSKNILWIEGDFLDENSLSHIPDFDVAYYLIHSMSHSLNNFQELEEKCARNFGAICKERGVKQVIYLSGIVNETNLSAHLRSRLSVEDILGGFQFNLTTLRCGIIVGSGSASFEIIRDLVEKLPVMITPKWLNTKCQPIAIRNVLEFLTLVIGKSETYNKSFDIGGADIYTYKEMLLLFAKVRGLKRFIWTLPIMTPKLSSYWLYFVTSTSYKLAVNLVDSMKINVICKPNNLGNALGIELIPYEQAIRNAFDKIEQNNVLSSWTDALNKGKIHLNLKNLIEVPVFGCHKDIKKSVIRNEHYTLNKIFSVGGKNGWYYGNWLWNLRGFIDKMVGGVGIRRGRRNQKYITAGETLDFWRVIYASREEKRLLLYAEMKLPGEAWLEWKINDGTLTQTATFRPKGIMGRLYWYSVLPFHLFIFSGMINKMVFEK